MIIVAYHNPLWVADRMVLLDHLTRGRSMLGVGPGSLPTDSAMIGLDPTDTRELLEVDLDIIMRLLRGEVPVTQETKTHRLVDARLHLRPYSDPLLRHRRAPPSRRRPVRGSPASTASGCCRSAPP